MRRSELRQLVQEAVSEVYLERRQRIDEGLLKSFAEKILGWLFAKLKKISPETYDRIFGAIKEKNKEELDKTFNDPKVKDLEKTITESILSEAEAEKGSAGGKLKKILDWIKENKTSLTVYTILGLITTVVGIVHAGGISEFLIDVGPKIAGSAAAGALGGFGFGFAGDAISQAKALGSSKNVDWKDALIAGVDSSKRGFVAGLLAGPLAGVASTLFSQFGIGGVAGAKLMGVAAGGAAARLPELIKYVEQLPNGTSLLKMLYSRRERAPHLKEKKKDIENWYKWAIKDKGDGLVESDLDHSDVKVALMKLLQNKISEKEYKALKVYLTRQHGIVYGK